MRLVGIIAEKGYGCQVVFAVVMPCVKCEERKESVRTEAGCGANHERAWDVTQDQRTVEPVTKLPSGGMLEKRRRAAVFCRGGEGGDQGFSSPMRLMPT